jgi:site-specific recombinase XerD
MKSSNDFSMLLTSFLSKYLPGQRNVSTNTVMSYRDNFKLFICYCTDERGFPLKGIQMQCIDRKMVLDYLGWLELKRGCSISTRNQRLAAFKSFFHYVATETPDYLFQCQQIVSIPMKKTAGKVMNYLSPEGIHHLLMQPDTRTWKGRRDHALLVLLYDAALRVQELVDLQIHDLRLDSPAVAQIVGKGRKARTIPLNGKTAAIVGDYITELRKRTHCTADAPLFQNSRGSKLTRVGISEILQKYVMLMKENGLGQYIMGTLSPHSLRHSKAIHLLRSGVPLIYIRDYLGHVSVTTTEIYARVDAEEKRKAVENAYPVQSQEKIPKWEKDKDLLEWLTNLCN